MMNYNIVTAILLLALITIIIFNRKTIKERNLLAARSEAYENQLEMYSKLDDGTARFRHDMANHLFVIQQLSVNGKSESAVEYIDKLFPMITPQKRFSNSGNIVIDSLLNSKLSAIEEADIQVFTSVPSESAVDKNDLCIVIGNLVDNAVEAVKKCNGEKMIKINIDEDSSGIYIDIENTYEGILLPYNKLLKTTKAVKSGHGIGLSNVSQVVDKYSGEMAVDFTDSMFRVEVDMYVG